jgi:hypothetical protein
VGAAGGRACRILRRAVVWERRPPRRAGDAAGPPLPPDLAPRLGRGPPSRIAMPWSRRGGEGRERMEPPARGGRGGSHWRGEGEEGVAGVGLGRRGGARVGRQGAGGASWEEGGRRVGFVGMGGSLYV